MSPRRVLIVGGGITGLAAAHALESARRDGRAEYQVLEAADRVGGNVRTETHGGYVVEPGPDGFVVSKPHAADLCRAVGLGDELIETQAENRRVYVVRNGRLIPFPEGMFLAAPSRMLPVLRSPLLSPRGRVRVALEPLIPRGDQDHEESIAGFIGRRLGREAADVFAEPILAGIYAGDPDALSIRATFPQLVTLEREHGGLYRGARALMAARARKATPGGKTPSAFLSLRAGMSALPDAVAASLAPQTVHTRTRAAALERVGSAWRVRTTDGGVFDADAVLLAVPAPVASGLIEPLDAECAALLREVPHLSTATAYYAFAREQVPHALDATGFLVPAREQRTIAASTWISSKWPGRAPAGRVLLRVFFGGARDPNALDRTDEQLLALGRAELRALVGITAEPEFSRVYRWVRSNPQPNVGHLARMDRVARRLGTLPGLFAAGGGYLGVGLPDCIKQGQAAAAAALR